MTILKSRAKRRALGSFSPERTKIRTLLKKAARGNAYAFVQAVSPYANLISQYLYLQGYRDETTRVQRIQALLADCWKYLPYTRRVSDFERFLQVQLERIPAVPAPSLPDPHTALETLSHQERFLLCARILEGWEKRYVQLAFRINESDFQEEMMALRCKLVGLRFQMLKPKETFQILRVSNLLEGDFTQKQATKVEKELAQQFSALQFKADWLSYRCELADMRIAMLLEPPVLDEVMLNTADELKNQPMEQPRFSDSIINQISFVRLPAQS